MSGKLQHHRVRAGETLRTIAAHYYRHDHKGELWAVIYRYNKHIIADPNQLNPGLRIVIPYVTGHCREGV